MMPPGIPPILPSSTEPQNLPANAPKFAHMGVTPQLVPPPNRNAYSTRGLLHSQYPADYAQLVNPMPLSQVAPSTQQALKTLNKVRTHQTVKDPELSNLEDNMKRGGSFLIATLATVGLKQRILGLREYLGFLSWFGAMAVTPKVINSLINLKTGVNLNQMYESTYDEKKNLFTDPHYMPLQIVPDDKMRSVANRFSIPQGPDRRQQTEEKIRQISIQGRTWWMLVAGPATPVISGLLCDRFEKPLLALTNQIRLASGRLSVALTGKNLDKATEAKLEKRVARNIDCVVGELPESMLTGWWSKFSRGILQQTGLKQYMSTKKVVDGTAESRLQTMLELFEKLQSDPVRLERLERFLAEQTKQLAKLQADAHKLLKPLEGSLPENIWRQQHRFVQMRIANAATTISHYEVLLKALKSGSQSMADIRIMVEKTVLPEVQRLIKTGHYAEAQRLAGSTDVYRKIVDQLQNRQFDKAFNQMGASIDVHLRNAMTERSLRKLWQSRIINRLGGGLLLASALYVGLFVGRDFGKTPKQTPEQKGVV